MKNSSKKTKKYSDRQCRRRGLVHVYRFLRYLDGFNHDVHPKSPERFPKIGVFKCTECGDEVILRIRHRS